MEAIVVIGILIFIIITLIMVAIMQINVATRKNNFLTGNRKNV